MKRRLYTVLLATALMILGRDLRAADEIHWTLTGPTSVSIDWRGPDSTLAYGLATADDNTATGVTPSPLPFSSAGPFWEARITGLLPDTLYHYSIAGGPVHTFRTMPAPGSEYTVFVESDIGESLTYPRVAVVQSLIAAAAPRFVLAVGDLTYADDDGQPGVDRHFNDMMVWSQDAAYMPAWGNHEWTKPSDDPRNYKGRFDLPNPQASPNAPAAGCCGEDWYWFDCGRVRFIAYPEPYSGAWAEWATHAGPLMDQAEADPTIRFIVTFGHRPPYSSGYHPSEATLRAILTTLSATHPKYVLNLNGHSHDYERSLPQGGVTYVTVGIGGSSLEETHADCRYAGGCPAPAWSAARAYHHGALRLRFTDSAIHGDVLCGPPGDSGTNLNDISCALGETFDSFTVGDDHAPIVTAPSTATVEAGFPFSLTATALDPDGDTILSLAADASALPAANPAVFHAVLGNSRGTLTWMPASNDTGTFTVTFHATNALRDSATVRVHVIPHPPDPHAPHRFAIDQVVPVPASSAFRIAYTLTGDDEARIDWVDAAGRVVRRQGLGHPGPGAHEVTLGGGPELPTGILWLRLTQGSRTSSHPMVVVR